MYCVHCKYKNIFADFEKSIFPLTSQIKCANEIKNKILSLETMTIIPLYY